MHEDPVHKQGIYINKQWWVYSVRVPIGFCLIIPTWANMAVVSVILEKLGRVYIFFLLENNYSVHAQAACSLIHWGRVTHAYMRPKTIPSLVQKMACRLVGANPLSEPMLWKCWLDPWSATPRLGGWCIISLLIESHLIAKYRDISFVYNLESLANTFSFQRATYPIYLRRLFTKWNNTDKFER